MIVEICANSFESAHAAQEAGAARIELCTELSVGGLTPSHGLIAKVIDEIPIPVHVLIRPRSGNFTYTKEELDIMLRDITYCKSVGCAGVVSGVLEKDFSVDTQITKQLIAAAQEMEFTFHRAFDWVPNPKKAIATLVAMGITRVLSSGQETSALKGISLLQELNKNYGHKIQVMPGGGINTENCSVFKKAGFKMIHCSASKKTQTLQMKPLVAMHSQKFFEEGIVSTSDKVIIQEIIKKLND